MQKLINFLRGSVRVEVTGAFPERFLNLCAQAGIGFWELEWPDGTTLRLRVARSDFKRLEPLARRVMCELKVIRRTGVPDFLGRFRRRYALLAGLALSLTAVCVLSQFILTVEVEGNVTVPTSAILEQLRREGVYPGAYGPAIDENLAGNSVLLNISQLAWVSVNLHGTRAQVLVRERSPKPEIVDESVPTHVVAGASGILTQVEVRNGRAVYHEGDTVVEGEVVISGIMELREPAYTEIDMGTMTVHAQGKVYARTWRTLSAVLPLTAQVKQYTGEEQTTWRLSVLGHCISLWGSGVPAYEQYDKQASSHTLTLPGGRELPFTLSWETARAYQLAQAQIDPEQGEQMLQERLTERLEELMEQTEGEVLATEFTAAQKDGMLTVTLVAECSEQIGREVPFEGKVGRNQPAGQQQAEEE